MILKHIEVNKSEMTWEPHNYEIKDRKTQPS